MKTLNELAQESRVFSAETLGTVRSIMGAKGSFKIVKDTEAPHASICILDEDNKYYHFICSATLTKLIRAGNTTRSEVASLNVVIGENDIPCVVMPQGTGAGWTKASELKDVAFNLDSVSQFEALAL